MTDPPIPSGRVDPPDASDPPIGVGRVHPRVAAAVPGLGLAFCAVEVSGDVTGRSPPAVRARLRGLADRTWGGDAAVLRSRPIPNAYRMLFRTLGLEPDATRVPVEAHVVERLTHGGYRSRGRLADALLVATIETGVGVWALAGVTGPLGLVPTGEGVAVADDAGPIVPVFATPPRVGSGARRIVLYALTAPGVPEMTVAEALWVAAEVLAASGSAAAPARS